MKHVIGNSYPVEEGYFFEKFMEHATSWDCKEAETVDNSSRWYGDEIGVGGLWQDKSQKDFKSYL